LVSFGKRLEVTDWCVRNDEPEAWSEFLYLAKDPRASFFVFSTSQACSGFPPVTVLAYPTLVGEIDVPSLDSKRLLWAATGFPGHDEEVSKVVAADECQQFVVVRGFEPLTFGSVGLT